jgi:glutathione S-transferase
VIGGDAPNAADLQIGATLRVLLCLGDLRPLLEGRAGERIARAWFPEYRGDVPAGAFPAGWVPAPR